MALRHKLMTFIMECKNEHTIYGACHRQQVIFGEIVPLEISNDIPLGDKFLVHTKCAFFPLQSPPLQSCPGYLDHNVSFDIFDVESPFGDSALELLLSEIVSALSCRLEGIEG